MAQRITQSILESRVKTLNSLTGMKIKHIKSRSAYEGKEFGLDYAYGGVKVVLKDAAGSIYKSFSGYETKKEAGLILSSMISLSYLLKDEKKLK